MKLYGYDLGYSHRNREAKTVMLFASYEGEIVYKFNVDVTSSDDAYAQYRRWCDYMYSMDEVFV